MSVVVYLIYKYKEIIRTFLLLSLHDQTPYPLQLPDLLLNHHLLLPSLRLTLLFTHLFLLFHLLLEPFILYPILRLPSPYLLYLLPRPIPLPYTPLYLLPHADQLPSRLLLDPLSPSLRLDLLNCQPVKLLSQVPLRGLLLKQYHLDHGLRLLELSPDVSLVHIQAILRLG